MQTLDRCFMTKHEIECEFWTLCAEADAADTIESSVPDLEPYLLRILEFVKANVGDRDTLVHCFTQLVDGTRPLSEWIVLFCMRELQWSEIQEAANLRFEKAGGKRAPRLMNWISDINWAYDNSPWESADFFWYFWSKEHPGEPWPCQAPERD